MKVNGVSSPGGTGKSASTFAFHKQRNSILKFSIVTSIAVVAAIIGYFAFESIYHSENEQFDNAYYSLMDQIIPAAVLGKQ